MVVAMQPVRRPIRPQTRRFTSASARPSRVALLLVLLVAGRVAAQSPPLDIQGLTFVSSQGEETDIVVWAETARFHTETDIADLQVVKARVSTDSADGGFEVECDEGTLNLTNNAFHARGNVRGRTDDGRDFTADWVRYDHAEGVLFTDEPVLISESGTMLQGGGFRYFVSEDRFRLLGGAKVVAEPSRAGGKP